MNSWFIETLGPLTEVFDPFWRRRTLKHWKSLFLRLDCSETPTAASLGLCVAIPCSFPSRSWRLHGSLVPNRSNIDSDQRSAIGQQRSASSDSDSAICKRSRNRSPTWARSRYRIPSRPRTRSSANGDPQSASGDQRRIRPRPQSRKPGVRRPDGCGRPRSLPRTRSRTPTRPGYPGHCNAAADFHGRAADPRGRRP